MTSSDLSSPPDTTAPHDSVPSVVAALTGAIPVAVTVTAVVVTYGHSAYLRETLAAVRAQRTAPDSIVVVDAAAAEVTAAYPDLHLGDARFVAAPRARSFGQAVDVALAASADSGSGLSGWLWLLHDDSAPEPDALAELLRAVEHSAAVAIAGPKQRQWVLGESDDPGRLLEVGYRTSSLGRRMTGIAEGEIDQGQHDANDDVLAVGLAGALVRRAVWQEVGGTDPELGPFGDDLDLCRRVRLAGHRVIVVPQAVVRHAQVTLLGLRRHPGAPDGGSPDASYGARRRSQFHTRLVWVPLPLLPFVALAMVLAAPFHAMHRLVVKQPRKARDELVAPVWALLRVGAVVRARRTAHRTARLPRRTLRPFVRGTWREVLAERRDLRLARVEQQRTGSGPTEVERAALRTLARSRRAVLAGVAAGLVGLTVLVYGPLLGTLTTGGRLVGGGLLPADTDLGDVWRSATSGWIATGLGAPAPADPFVQALVPATLIAGSAQNALNALVVGAMAVAGLGAWFAAGALTRSVAVRAWAVVAWVAAPVLLEAVTAGRVGALVAHAALPWTALAVARALGLQRTDMVRVDRTLAASEARSARPEHEPGSLGAAAAAGLALAVAVAGAPVLLVAATLCLGIVAVAVRRHRRFLLLVPVPAAVLFAPFYVHVLATLTDGGWRLLLADPGAPVASDPATAWQQVLGQPVAAASWFGADAAGPLGLVAGWAPLIAGGVVVLLAVAAVGLARRGAAIGWAIAAVGLATAVLAGATSVAPATSAPYDEAVTGWPGAGLSLMLLALLGVAVSAVPRLPARTPEQPRGRTIAVAVTAVVVTGLPLAGLASWSADVLDRTDASVGAVRATTAPVVPPVGQQMQRSSRQARVLSVEPARGSGVDYALLRADGPQAVDASAVVHKQSLADPAAVQGDLPQLVAELAAGSSADVAARLGDIGVGAVLLPAAEDSQARAELVARLDMVPGLERVTEGQSGVIWRVAPETEPTWARVESSAAATVGVPSTDLRIDTTIEPGAEDRLLVLAQTAARGWTATLDGHALKSVDPARTGGLQAFRLGSGGGQLEVVYVTDYRTAWLAVTSVTLLIYVLLAVPVRRRRAGTR